MQKEFVKHIIIGNEDYTVAENFSDSIPFKLTNAQNQKRLWVWDVYTNDFGIFDGKGRKITTVKKSEIIKEKINYNFNQIY